MSKQLEQTNRNPYCEYCTTTPCNPLKCRAQQQFESDLDQGLEYEPPHKAVHPEKREAVEVKTKMSIKMVEPPTVTGKLDTEQNPPIDEELYTDLRGTLQIQTKEGYVTLGTIYLNVQPNAHGNQPQYKGKIYLHTPNRLVRADGSQITATLVACWEITDVRKTTNDGEQTSAPPQTKPAPIQTITTDLSKPTESIATAWQRTQPAEPIYVKAKP